MKIDWSELRNELKLWHAAGLSLHFWWRDDDATEASGALDRLTRLSEDVCVPVHLACVPKFINNSLVDHIGSANNLVPVTHGWAHTNHAPSDQKKAEFGAHRPIEAMALDIEIGVSHFQNAFVNSRPLMFVPPWNRIDSALPAILADAGYTVLSTFTPRKQALVAGLTQVNTHLDPIAWKDGKTLVEPEKLIAQLLGLLQDRRTGITDNAEPLGLLTHHLVHTQDVWEFARQMIVEILDGPVALFDLRGAALTQGKTI